MSLRIVAALAVAASFCYISPRLRAEPCRTSSVMQAGAEAPCSGLLVDARRMAQCVADAERASAAEARLDGCVMARAEERKGCDAVRAELEARLAEAVTPKPVDPGWDWTAFGVGLGLGAAIVAGVVVGVVVAGR